MQYLVVKAVHETAVALSAAGFFARGLGGLLGATWVRGRVARTLPHVVDTVLLGSALLLAWMLGVTPIAAPWLAAKIGGLLVYVGLGTIALRRGCPRRARFAAWIGALAVFGWIVSVAITKNPWGFVARALA